MLSRRLHQRYHVRKLRNLEAKMPQERWREVKADALAAYDAASPKTGGTLGRGIQTHVDHRMAHAVKCFEDDFAACSAHLKLTLPHRRAIRTIGLLKERLFREERRRSKTVSHAFGTRGAQADVRRHPTGESNLAAPGDNRLRAPAADHPAQTIEPRVRCKASPHDHCIPLTKFTAEMGLN